MQTRLSLDLDLTTEEQLRLLQVWQYLVELESGDAVVPRELADFLAGANAQGDLPERRFKELIGTDDPGLEFIHAGGTKLRIYDRDGAANLRVLCKIIAHVIPRVIPLEFSFALIDEANHCYSGGIVVMKEGVAEIQTIDSLLARHLGRLASPGAATGGDEDQPLRDQCMARIAELKSKPAIIALVRRGVDFDPDAKRAFRREASRTLRQIGCELGLSHDLYSIHHEGDRYGAAGDVTLASAGVHIRISAIRFTAGREITFRVPRTRHDEFGRPPRHGDIGRLADIPRFAARIAAELGLELLCGQGRFLLEIDVGLAFHDLGRDGRTRHREGLSRRAADL